MNESLKRYHALREIALDSGLQKDWDAVFKAQVAAEKEQQAGVPPALTESPMAAHYPKVLKEEKPMPKKTITDTGTTIPSEGATPRTRASGDDLVEKRTTKAMVDLDMLGKCSFKNTSDARRKEVVGALEKALAATIKKITEAGKEPEQVMFHFTK